MDRFTNSDRPALGAEVPGFAPPPVPDGSPLEGAFCRLEKLSADEHAAALFKANAPAPQMWDYMPVGPFASAAQYHRWMREASAGADPLHYAIWCKDAGAWGGSASFLRIKPQAGSIELGYIALSPVLQRSRAATEAFFLMMDWAFGAGYRRFEWKCNALNMPSRRAAQRLGLTYEGVFRQADVVKGRNRDTAWFAAIDSEWPALREAFAAWLAPSNFDASGQQRERLGDLTGLVRQGGDPALG
ncbi:GNAT family N-acetyltransferase [Alphaproteobacteria bacterium KMM 3653]|uniref:GNAT family N-acetyltransferase n=1 Tax=Harenicola maris TaxID=2841044 RepID=A0AAP2CPH1_9RHOB|nr:GNAT family N-acetyltransferase [Harenicola maris]